VIEPEDLSGNLIVQLGLATEGLNRRWVLTDVQEQVRHPALRWMKATLDGRVEATASKSYDRAVLASSRVPLATMVAEDNIIIMDGARFIEW
jgi:hypothetical protein